MRLLDLKGRVFGRLTALEGAENNKHGRARWLCACECGNQTVVDSYNLRSSHSRSCGCLSREMSAARETTHGHCRGGRSSRTYKSYAQAKDRCQNPKNKDFHRWGGRGIRFRFESFEEFLAELGLRPKGMTLERILNDGDYEPGNVVWATPRQQANNRRDNRKVTAFGRTRTVANWARVVGINRMTLMTRLRLGWPPERALTTTRTGYRSRLREALATVEDSTVAGRGRPQPYAAGSEVR